MDLDETVEVLVLRDSEQGEHVFLVAICLYIDGILLCFPENLRISLNTRFYPFKCSFVSLYSIPLNILSH